MPATKSPLHKLNVVSNSASRVQLEKGAREKEREREKKKKLGRGRSEGRNVSEAEQIRNEWCV